MATRPRRIRAADELETLPAVGPSIAQDLHDLGIHSVAALRRRDPERLYAALNRLRGERQDPCVLYTFRCAVYAARTARPRPALLKWWNWKGRTLAGVAALLLVAALAAAPLGAQHLGRVEFPNSGRSAAQAPFLRGLMLLHSFEYEDAAGAFREAQAADSGFAMAYWGEAMTHNHPLWNEQNQAAARAILQRLGPTPEARRLKAPTEREQRYLEAVERLYFLDAPKSTRDTLYSLAMERIARSFPEDDDGQTFYALSLMGLSQGTRNIPSYMRAGAIAEEIYRRNPQHPGALHYIIHAFDDPVHAPLGLRAAREYSAIAADADHAQHMTTHIFLALGMWPETVRQNAIASGPDSAGWRPGHYTSWHSYGLLQLGQYQAAARHLATVRRNLAAAATPGRLSYMVTMRAHYLINTERWADSAAVWALELDRSPPGVRAIDAYVLGVAQLAQGRRAPAEAALGKLEAMAQAAARDTSMLGSTKVPGILADQLRARLLWGQGRRDSALALLRTAAGKEESIPAEFGPPDIVKPTYELMGELLLAADRAPEAMRAFNRALELTPGRSLSLLGLARAARKAGDEGAAGRALARLQENWRGADAGIAGLAEVTRSRTSD